MKNDALINVIVPVYGVERYLERCIDSILAQTYQNFRLILVDDGSPDHCPEICDRYQAMDTRITVIHRKNGGQSAARNSGLMFLLDESTPKGDYVAFIDGDDYVAPDYLEFLYDMLMEQQADIVQCGAYLVYSERRKKIDRKSAQETELLNRRQVLESLCYNGAWTIGAWGKLYKLHIFDEIRFPEGKLYEDTAISYRVASVSERFAYNLTPKYYYVQRYDSTANGVEWKDYKYQYLEAGDALAAYVASYEPSLAKAANAKKVFVRLSTLSQMVNCNHYDKRRIAEMKQVIMKYRSEVWKNPKVATRDKLGILAISFGFPIYKTAWRMYYRLKRRK